MVEGWGTHKPRGASREGMGVQPAWMTPRGSRHHTLPASLPLKVWSPHIPSAPALGRRITGCIICFDFIFMSPGVSCIRSKRSRIFQVDWFQQQCHTHPVSQGAQMLW